MILSIQWLDIPFCLDSILNDYLFTKEIVEIAIVLETAFVNMNLFRFKMHLIVKTTNGTNWIEYKSILYCFQIYQYDYS